MQSVDKSFSIQGISAVDICEQYGTPLYVYDAETILRQYNRLKNAFSGVDLKIKYAAKALTNQAIIKLLRQAGSGIDVVSIQEIHLALKAGYTAGDIMFTPSCAPFEEIMEAISLGTTVNIDSIPYLEKFGETYGSDYSCCVRVNPHIDAGGNIKIMTGHKRSKFGISIEQMEEVYAVVKKHGIKVSGLHIHSGSDFKDPEAFVKAAEVLFKMAENFSELKFIDLGSGFKVPYKEGDHATDIEALGKKMSEAFIKFCESYGRKLELWFEPGKFLVSESGLLLVNVTVVKPSSADTFIGVNSGLNHLIRPMMYDAHHDITNISNPDGKKGKYTVVGYICETDTFATDIDLTEVRPGDILAIKNAGAYGFSMSSNYNSRFRPAEVLVYNKKPMLIRKRETMDDLLKNQVDVEL